MGVRESRERGRKEDKGKEKAPPPQGQAKEGTDVATKTFCLFSSCRRLGSAEVGRSGGAFQSRKRLCVLERMPAGDVR